MSLLIVLHMVAGVLLVLASAIVGIWGIFRAKAIGRGARRYEAVLFGHILQISHTMVGVVGLLGLWLFMSGDRPADPLHARIYGPFMVVAIVAGFAYRSRDALKNVRIFSIVALIIFALGLRALVTGG